MALALYDMEPIGVDGALEATGVIYFCSPECRLAFAKQCQSPPATGEDSEFLPGHRCEECGKELAS